MAVRIKLALLLVCCFLAVSPASAERNLGVEASIVKTVFTGSSLSVDFVHVPFSQIVSIFEIAAQRRIPDAPKKAGRFTVRLIDIR